MLLATESLRVEKLPREVQTLLVCDEVRLNLNLILSGMLASSVEVVLVEEDVPSAALGDRLPGCCFFTGGAGCCFFAGGGGVCKLATLSCGS